MSEDAPSVIHHRRTAQPDNASDLDVGFEHVPPSLLGSSSTVVLVRHVRNYEEDMWGWMDLYKLIELRVGDLTNHGLARKLELLVTRNHSRRIRISPQNHQSLFRAMETPATWAIGSSPTNPWTPFSMRITTPEASRGTSGERSMPRGRTRSSPCSSSSTL